MPLRKQDSDKTAFIVPCRGHFEFTEWTRFGLKGACYSFQRMMSVILQAFLILQRHYVLLIMC